MSGKASKKAWKLAAKMTDEQAKKFDEELKKLEKDVENKLFVPVVEVVASALFALAQENVKVVSLIFIESEDGKTATVEMRIGALEFIDGEGNKAVIADTSAIRSIESEGGEIDDE